MEIDFKNPPNVSNNTLYYGKRKINKKIIKENINYQQNKNIEKNKVKINKKILLKWLVNKNLSCRYDSFLTLFGLCLENNITKINFYDRYKEIVNDLYLKIEELKKGNFDAREKFWSKIDKLGLDTEKINESLFEKDGFVAGLFIIMNNNSDL